MSEPTNTDTAGATAPKAGLAMGIAWARGGWDQVTRGDPHWIGMGAVYLVSAAILRGIPFAGQLLVVLLSPMLLGGALLALEGRRSAAAAAPLSAWLTAPARQLTLVFADERQTFTAVLLGIVTLGLVLTVLIVEQVLGVGTLTGSLRGASMGSTPPGALLMGVLLATGFNVIVAMALFFAVHFAILDRREPLAALAESFRACRRHPWALTAYTTVFFIPYLVFAYAFRVSALLGFLLLFTLGPFVLASFVVGTHIGFRQLYPAKR